MSWVTLCFNKSVQWRSYLFALASPGEFTSKSKEKLDFQTFDIKGRQESESGIRATILQQKKNTVNTLDQVVFQRPITTHNRNIVKDGFRRNTPLVHQHLKRLGAINDFQEWDRHISSDTLRAWILAERAWLAYICEVYKLTV